MTIHLTSRLPRTLLALCSCVFAAVALVPAAARGNHGPGTSGGGSSTISGETLRQGRFDLSLRTDYTQFEDVSRAGAEARAIRAGNFDALDYSVLTTASLSFGITDDLQASATIGYYAANNFIDAEVEDGEAESATTDPDGLTDLYLALKYRVLRGQPGNLAIIGGVKLPTGKDDVRLDNGEILEPSSQPGSGAFDYQFGLAYSRFLTPRVTVDASALYTLRTEHDDFKVGDRFDAGVAVNYRLTESIQSFPQVSVFGEALYVHLAKDEESGERETNSGGDAVYLSPGLRVRFNEAISLTVAPAFPVVQELNGEQIEVRWKAAVTLSVAF